MSLYLRFEPDDFLPGANPASIRVLLPDGDDFEKLAFCSPFAETTGAAGLCAGPVAITYPGMAGLGEFLQPE